MAGEKQIKTKEENSARYQLRKAAGIYWLIDRKQEGVPFRKPVTLNEMGADIWRLLMKMQKNQVVENLCGEYQINREQAERDIEQFLDELRKYGISV